MTTSGRSYGTPETRTVFVYNNELGINVLFQSKNTMEGHEAEKLPNLQPLLLSELEWLENDCLLTFVQGSSVKKYSLRRSI